MSGLPSGRLLVGVAAAFGLLATLNAGGYRYGVSDQAFYIPAMLASADPSLFPRDRELFSPQGAFTLFDDGFAMLWTVTGAPLPWMFFAGYLLTLGLLAVGYVQLGRLMFRSAWTSVAFCLAMTLKHRITRTGVNTLEGYFHPRMLAFAIGLLALSAFLNGRPLTTVGLVALAGFIHPTTGLWFAICLGTALVVSGLVSRRLSIAAGVVAVALGVWVVVQGGQHRLFTRMDAAWLEAFAAKDYVLPLDWPVTAWMVNMAYPVIIMATYLLRRRSGRALPREGALVAGLLALVGLFLASLPFMAVAVALALQLQVSRVFWLLDVMATLYVVWWLAEGPQWSTTPHRTLARRAALVAAVVAAAASLRGAYVGFFEHPERPPVQIDLPQDDWHDVMAWLRTTPADTHVLADSGHAWRYGSSVRVAAARDVYLEEVKDTAMALYSRAVALSVVERIREVGSQNEWTEASLLALAARAGLDLVVTERIFDLPLAYENRRFRVYRLGTHPRH